MLDIGISPRHFETLSHIADTYLERALEQYDADKGTPREADTVAAMINSLTDRLAMVEARALRTLRDLLHAELTALGGSCAWVDVRRAMEHFDRSVQVVREEE